MIEGLLKRANSLEGEYKHLVRLVREEKLKLKEAKELLENTKEAQGLIQEVSQKVQEQAHSQIASIVSKCLTSVFSSPYEFRILFEKKRNKTEARLVFLRDGKEIDPTSASGGGVLDVASFALRLACLMMSKPKLRRVLILDEPFKHLSKNYRPRVRTLLEELSEELKVQIVMVTHDEEFQIGDVVEIGDN